MARLFVTLAAVIMIEGQMAANPPQQGAGRLVAVVVTHDRPDQLRQTVEALLASSQPTLAAVVVVDNASQPETGAWLAACADSRLHVLTLAENRGGAGGFEAGMRHAMAETRPDWLVLMDDDARPEAGALLAFHALELDGWDAVAAAVRHPDGSLCEMNRPTLNPFLRPGVLARAMLGRGREAFHMAEPDFAVTQLRPVDGASFVGLFLSRRVIERMGYPDGRLFIYADDAIYTHALTRAGFRMAFAPSLRFLHDSTTFSLTDPRIRPLWKVYYYHRNLIELYRQASGLFFVPVLVLYLPRWLMRLRHHGGERRAFLRLFRRALGDGLRRRLDVPHAQILSLAQGDAPAARELAEPREAKGPEQG